MVNPVLDGAKEAPHSSFWTQYLRIRAHLPIFAAPDMIIHFLVI